MHLLLYGGADEYYIENMGALSTVLGDDKNTITKLILKGQINSYDFEVMKSGMPNLTYVDLSQVTCDGNYIPFKAFGVGDTYYVDNSNKKISTIILPKSITRIDFNAFHRCESLTGDLIIPDKVKSIGSSAFYSSDGIFNGALKLSADLEEIGKNAFKNCKFTGPLDLPAKLTKIGNDAFFACEGFTGSLTIPNGVTKIETGTFSYCKGLTGSLTLPEGVTTIETRAFNGSGFSSISMPSTLETIGNYAFFTCKNLKGPLTITEGVTTIGQSAFYDCVGLDGTLSLPSSLKTIGQNAFRNCSKISGTIVFPQDITSIDINAFLGCESVGAFKFTHTTPIPYTGQMLWTEGTSVGKTPIQVPASAVEDYKAAPGWSDHAANIVAIPAD